MSAVQPLPAQSYFSVVPPIKYEGPKSDNPLAFRVYNKDQVVLGKRMEDHLRPAVCYWHSFAWDGHDIFGQGTFQRPWNNNGPMNEANAWAKMDAAFDFFTRLGAPFYCFHDVDAMPAAANIKEHVENLAKTVDRLEKKQNETGVKLLWGTANLFSHPRFMGGASTNPDPEVWAFAATQVRHCLDATRRLGGSNYVLWGGREGYDTLLNTNLKRELANFGRFLQLVVEHKHKIGFKGTILIEPKPHEPTKHQYDFDTATVYGFLKKNGLENEVKVNIEANHATLAGHSFDHEIAMADALGIFGSIDINRGDPQNGWDTDQFHNDPLDMTLAMYRILKAGGFTTGGFNFDAKVRRQSIDPSDMFHGHVGGLDLLARSLLSAAALIENGGIDKFVEQRYAKWDGELGKKIHAQGASLEGISDWAVSNNVNPKPQSGRQEMLENLVNRFV
jgi:xylose isomerase